jgi:GTP-binding protein
MSERGWDIIKARFVASAAQPCQYPAEGWPEAAFIGRSNVGKSSLINALCQRRALAKTSSSPGKTRTVNFFAAEAKCAGSAPVARREFFLVDLPGYGFARAGKAVKEAWAGFIRLYFASSSRLRVVCQLIDIRHDLPDNDRRCYEWLQTIGVPLQVVFTKADKLSAAAALVRKNSLCRELGLPASQAVLFSALKQEGRSELIERIAGRLW